MKNFENENMALTRLLQEVQEHGSIVIAFDFDNTIYDYHNHGLDMTNVMETLKDSYDLGMKLFCFTANEDHSLVTNEVEKVLGISFIGINKSPVEIFDSRKPFYSILLDDRAGLGEATRTLQTFNQLVRLTHKSAQ